MEIWSAKYFSHVPTDKNVVNSQMPEGVGFYFRQMSCHVELRGLKYPGQWSLLELPDP